jgi:hypothetical protein
MGTWHEVQYTLVIISRLINLRMKIVLERRCRENQNKHFIFNNFFPKIVPLEKYGRARQTTHDNMVHSHRMLDS